MRLDTPPLRDLARPPEATRTERLGGFAAASPSPAPPASAKPGPGAVSVVMCANDVPLLTSAPVDAEQVAAIRAALSKGSYVLDPAKTAAALIAAKPLLSVAQ